MENNAQDSIMCCGTPTIILLLTKKYILTREPLRYTIEMYASAAKSPFNLAMTFDL